MIKAACLVVLLLLVAIFGQHSCQKLHRRRHARRSLRSNNHPSSSSSSSSVDLLEDTEVLVTVANEAVYLGCSDQHPEVEWLRGSQVIEGVFDVNVGVSRAGDNKAANESESESSRASTFEQREEERRRERNRRIGGRLTSEFIANSGRHVLKINPVEVSDSGVWTCRPVGASTEAGSPAPKASSSWTLIVLPKTLEATLVPEKNLLEEPEKDNPDTPGEPVAIRVQEGDDSDLLCAVILEKKTLALESEEPMLAWRAEMEAVAHLMTHDAPDEPRKLLVQNRDDLVAFVSKAVVPAVTRDMNQGHLGCHASPGAGSAFGELRVEYPPTFTIVRTPGFGMPIIEGMTVSLECQADVKPDMHGSWLKDEEDRASINGTIILDAVSLHDIGWYQCYIIYNGDEYSSVAYFLNVQPAEHFAAGPHVTSPPSAANEVDVRKSALKTHDAANSDAGVLEVSVIDPDVSADAADSRWEGIRTSFSEETNLVAKNVMYAENPNCSGDPLQLYKAENPITIFPANDSLLDLRKFSSLLSQPLRLTFTVCSNPKPERLFWITPNGYALRPGQTSPDGAFEALDLVRDKINVTCHITTLVLSLTAEEDVSSLLGEYVVIASNRHGLEDAVLVLSDPRLARQGISRAAASLGAQIALLTAALAAVGLVLWT